MRKFKFVACGAIALAGILSGSDARGVTVSNVTELTNAIARSKSEIILKPGVYDLSTLEPFTATNAEGTVVLGTNYKADGNGYAHIMFRTKTSFRGENTKHWSEKTPEEETIIRGAGANDTMRLIYGFTGGGRGSTWSHITFENGGTNGLDGGAVFVTDPHLSPRFNVTNCVFRNNRGKIGGATSSLSAVDSLYERNTALKGGAASVKSCSTQGEWTNRLVNCVFRDNVSTGTGGGAVAVSYQSEIVGCVFTNNAVNGSGSGGAIKSENGLGSVISDCTFVDNSADVQGGAVYASHALAGFSNCTFLRNRALRGAAVWSDGAFGTITGCQVISNTASENSENTGAFYLPTLTAATDTTFAFNSSAGSRAGLVVTNFAKGLAVERCVFDSNTGGSTWNGGSQLYGIQNVVGCTFRGCGDMIAKNYDRCVFERCSFDYDNWGGGMLLFDTRTGGGHLRNCLFTNNTAHVYIDNASGAEVEISNCTFADNLAKSALNQGSGTTTNDGYIVYAFRGGDGGKNAQGTALNRPSTNLLVNCIFANNTWRNGERRDIPLYRTTTKVPSFAQNILSNCLYEVTTFDNSTAAVTLVNPVVAKPGFVAGDARYADQPACMIRRSSKARRAGLALPWMTDATDLAGAPMVSEGGTVDLGAYQCTLPQVGSLLLFW